MKHYAYRVIRNSYTNPIFGGTVSANSMDDAVTEIIRAHNIQVQPMFSAEDDAMTCPMYHEFRVRNQQVSIFVHANPKDYL